MNEIDVSGDNWQDNINKFLKNEKLFEPQTYKDIYMEYFSHNDTFKIETTSGLNMLHLYFIHELSRVSITLDYDYVVNNIVQIKELITYLDQIIKDTEFIEKQKEK